MTPQALAAQYGLATADTLPARAHAADHARLRERWSPQKRIAFDTLSPHALCVVGTDGPVSLAIYDAHGEVTRRIGHNRGVWPVKLASTSSWRDTVTARYDVNPFVFIGVQIRLWCASDAHERRLASAVYERLAVMEEDAGVSTGSLNNGFADVGPAFSYEIFEMEVAALAERLGIALWDDNALSAHLDRMLAASARKVGHRG